MKAILLFNLLLFTIPTAVSAQYTHKGEKNDWHGYEMHIDGHMKVVVPNKVATGRPWIWRARFFDLNPTFDLAMLNEGYHVVYCDVKDLYGSPQAVNRWDECYVVFRDRYQLSDRVVLGGMSRGGLIIYNWAIANPEKVAAIYGDAPVMDFKSWPGAGARQIHRAYEFKNTAEARAYKNNPINNLEPLAKAGIPIIHVVGDLDRLVPVSQNTGPAEKEYTAMGGIFEVIHKPEAKHEHGLEDPKPLVDFVLKHNSDR